jgi:hypothetical protein
MLSKSDQAFLRRRRAAARILPAAGALCVSVWLGLWIYLLLNQPLLTNPLYLVEQASSAAPDPNRLALLAGIAPIAVSGLFLTVLAFLLIALGAVLDQRRLLRVLDELQRPAPPGRRRQETANEEP